MTMTPEQFEAKMHRAAQEVKDTHTLLQRIALKVEGTAKRLSPVKTGNLRRSVTSRATAHEAIVGATANYAVYVHEGTSRMPGRPFIKDAIEEERGWIESEAQRFGEQALAKAAG